MADTDDPLSQDERAYRARRDIRRDIQDDAIAMAQTTVGTLAIGRVNQMLERIVTDPNSPPASTVTP